MCPECAVLIGHRDGCHFSLRQIRQRMAASWSSRWSDAASDREDTTDNTASTDGDEH